MSFETLVWVRGITVGSPTARAVLRVLADHAGQDHSCYLRTSLISAETELSDSTVRKALAHLINGGFVRVFERYHHGTGARRTNRYQLLLEGAETPEPDAEDWASVRNRAVSEEPTPPPGAGGGGLREPEGGAPGAGGGTLREPEGLPYKEALDVEASPVKGGAPRQQRTATRIPDDFIPSPEMRAWFAKEQLHHVVDVRTEHEKFMDYWRAEPGAKGRKLDWAATWRRWMRSAAERASRYGTRPVSAPPGSGLIPSYAATMPPAAPYRPSTTDQRVAQGLALAAHFSKEENR